MRRFIVIASVAATCAVAAPLALAGGVKPALGKQACLPVALSGQVSSVGGDSFVLDVGKSNRRALVGPGRTVSVVAATRFQIGRQRGALVDLVSGQPVDDRDG